MNFMLILCEFYVELNSHDQWLFHSMSQCSIGEHLSVAICWLTFFTLCSCSAAGSAFNMQTPASICPPAVEFIRMSFNNIVPDDLKGKDAMITTQYGTQRAYYAFKRITHPNGWAALLPLGEEFKLEFENAKQVTNISYSVKYYGLTVSIYCAHSQNCHTWEIIWFETYDDYHMNGAWYDNHMFQFTCDDHMIIIC